jgi:hypothetical protein
MLGEPLDLCQPTDDAFNWGPCYDWNFSVIRSSINSMATSTGTNAAAIATEAAARLAQDLLIGASTASLQTQLGAVGVSTGAIAVSTTSEAATRLAQDLSIGASTGSLQSQVTVLGVSTTSIAAATTTLHTENIVGSRIDGSTYTAAIALKAADASVVHLAGSENITGAKAFQATGASVYSLVTSSGISIQAGTLSVQGSGGVDASGTGIKGSTATLTASGNTQFSLYTSSGISIGAGTLLAQGPIQGTATGNATPGLILSSGAVIGSDVHVTGTLEATKLKGDGSQLTGIGGGGTVTTQGSPAAGQVAVFQAGTVLSSSPISVAYGAGGVATTTVSGSLAHPSGSAVSYANGAVTVYGDPTTGNMLNSSGVAVWAKSIDGITQSSGCLVAMQFANTNAKGAWFSATADTATLVFTSTTTTLTNVGVAIMPGVLLDTCAPLSVCHVGIKGIFRVQTTGASNQYPDFTTTRCAAGADNAFDASAVGGYMNTAPAAGMTWIQLR